MKRIFCNKAHLEPCKSDAARTYCNKEETYISGTRFEFGERKLALNNKKDWEVIRTHAKANELDMIPGDAYIRYYSNLKNISKDNLKPKDVERIISVYWGWTGTGKTHNAISYARTTGEPYMKDGESKWWDGYIDHETIIIDEFRGKIAIERLLRLLDKYPLIGETKGGMIALNYKFVFITSNFPPKMWYPDASPEDYEALKRRIHLCNYYDKESKIHCDTWEVPTLQSSVPAKIIWTPPGFRTETLKMLKEEHFDHLFKN